jgi:hypothetical protein
MTTTCKCGHSAAEHNEAGCTVNQGWHVCFCDVPKSQVTEVAKAAKEKDNAKPAETNA